MKNLFLPILLFLLITVVSGQNAIDDDINRIFNMTGNDFLSNYEEVTPPPLEELSALTKCGEGDQLDKFLCVPYHNCDSRTNTVIQIGSVDGAGIIDVRFGDGKCDHYLDVCCKLPADFNQSTTVTTPPTVTTPSTVTKTVVTSVTAVILSVNTTTTSTLNNTILKNVESFCGIRNANGIGFKITGNNNNEAEFGEFPWMVAILRQNYNPTSSEPLAVCGGSLITPRVVLTGAHCVKDYKRNNIKIRAGEWDTQTQREFIPYQERKISKIIIHERFVAKNLYNDVALLILDRPLVKADNVGTICLPSQNQNFNSGNCFATGWGKNVFGKEGKYSVILKKIGLSLVPHADCQRSLQGTRLGALFRLHESFTCAGGELGKDTCTGDGGSPLVCLDPNNPGRYMQAGIVAWGIGCGENQVPGVYADVSQFRNWIDQQLQKEKINPTPYTL